MGFQPLVPSLSYDPNELERQDGPSEIDPLLQNDRENLITEDDGNESTTTSDSDVQEGVRKVEAISKTWTQRSLIIAYLGYVNFLPSFRWAERDYGLRIQGTKG